MDFNLPHEIYCERSSLYIPHLKDSIPRTENRVLIFVSVFPVNMPLQVLLWDCRQETQNSLERILIPVVTGIFFRGTLNHESAIYRAVIPHSPSEGDLDCNWDCRVVYGFIFDFLGGITFSNYELANP